MTTSVASRSSSSAICAIVAASYASAWVARRIALLWTCGLWLLTAHYFYLFYENAGELDWVVGSFITVTAVTLGMLSRASLLAYSAFATALSIGIGVGWPPATGTSYMFWIQPFHWSRLLK